MAYFSEAVESKAIALACAVGLARRPGRTVDMLMRAECYWMAGDIWQAIVSSSKSLPLDFVLTDDLPPTQIGWIWIERPSDFLSAQSPPVCGICWGVGPHPSNQTALAIETFHRRAPNALLPLWYTYAAVGKSIAEEDARRATELRERGRSEDDAVALNALTRAVAATFLWLKQSIVVPERRDIQRHAAKRLADVQMQKSLNIVLLRRAIRDTHAARDTHDPVEWSCRWLVRGHWRQQYHPSTGKHEPAYILPHVKGPDDKPLKPPSATVFSVVR